MASTTVTATAVLEGQNFATETQAGAHRVLSDEPEANGGQDQGPQPTQMVLQALGACTAITLRMYANHKGWELGQIQVDVSLTMEEDRYHLQRDLHFGAQLDEKQKERLAQIADKCPTHKLLLASPTSETQVAD